jgi:hypothetical protein
VLAVITFWLVYRRKIVADTEPEVVEIDSSMAPSPAGSAALGRMN